MQCLLLAIVLFLPAAFADREYVECDQRLRDATHVIPDAHDYLWYSIGLTNTDRFKMAHRFGAIISGDRYTIEELFEDLGEDPSTTQFFYYKHPLYTEMLRWTLDTYVQHTMSFERPLDAHVDLAYQNHIELHIKRHNIGFDLDLNTERICTAASDAAGYFYWQNMFGYVQKYLLILEKYDCQNDFAGFITGEPQPLTEAIEEMKHFKALPEDYGYEPDTYAKRRE
jgi:hypothetical protein